MKKIVTVEMTIDLVEQLVKPWYLMKQWDAEKVRQACRDTLDSEDKLETGENGNGTLF